MNVLQSQNILLFFSIIIDNYARFVFSFLTSPKGPRGEQGPKGEQVKRRDMFNYLFGYLMKNKALEKYFITTPEVRAFLSFNLL